ncbi:hypothetical protein D3C85_1220920 [compost metagenome]
MACIVEPFTLTVAPDKFSPNSPEIFPVIGLSILEVISFPSEFDFSGAFIKISSFESEDSFKVFPKEEIVNKNAKKNIAFFFIKRNIFFCLVNSPAGAGSNWFLINWFLIG